MDVAHQAKKQSSNNPVPLGILADTYYLTITLAGGLGEDRRP